MRRRIQLIAAAVTMLVSFLLLSATLPTSAVALPGGARDQSLNTMAVSGLIVGAVDPNIVAGGTGQVVVELSGTTEGVDTTVQLSGANITPGLEVVVIDCGDCSTSDPVTYLFDGDSSSWSAAYTITVSVPSDATAGQMFTLGITANESSTIGVDSEYAEATFTIVAPQVETPALTEPPVSTEPAAPSETPMPTQTPTPMPTQTRTPVTPVATDVATAPQTAFATGTATATQTPTSTPTATSPQVISGESNARARITSADTAVSDEIPGGSVLLIRRGTTEVYSVTIGASGTPTSLPIGGTQGAILTTSQVPVDFPYGIYTVSFDAGAGFEPFVQNFTFDSPVDTIEIVLVPELGEGESSVDIRISSSDAALANELGQGTTISLTQGNRVEFDGALTSANLLQLPRTLSFTDPIDFGVYTLTIDAGEGFEVFTAQVVIDESPEQLVEVELQALTLTGRLVDVLKTEVEQIMADR